MYRTAYKALALLLFLLLRNSVSIAQSTEPLEPEWLKKDVEGVSEVLKLSSFENQQIEALKEKLKDTWSVEEQDFGFGGRRLDLGKGNGYTKIYIESFIFNGQVAYYELGVESYSEEWSRIRDDVIEAWRKNGNVEYEVSEHRIAYRKTLNHVLQSYRNAVASELGEMKSVDVPDELRKSYEYLISFMQNAAVSDGGCGLSPGFPEGKVAIDELLEHKRYDLIENVLKGHNPGGRVYAMVALLEKKREGLKLGVKTQRVIQKIINLNIPITTCAGCFAYTETAKKVVRARRL